MDQKTRTIIIGAVVLLILAAVLGTVFYLNKISKGVSLFSDINTSLPQAQITPLPTTAKQGSLNNGSATTGPKVYVGISFSVSYPQNWALLTCSNSQNIEFDPYGGNDIRGVVCDYAVKPVTLVVENKTECKGQSIKLGNNEVVKSKTTEPNGDINYQWCLPVGDKSLDITHRVSASGSRATSKDDFSALIEQMIGNIHPVTTGS